MPTINTRASSFFHDDSTGKRYLKQDYIWIGYGNIERAIPASLFIKTFVNYRNLTSKVLLLQEQLNQFLKSELILPVANEQCPNSQDVSALEDGVLKHTRGVLKRAVEGKDIFGVKDTEDMKIAIVDASIDENDNKFVYKSDLTIKDIKDFKEEYYEFKQETNTTIKEIKDNITKVENNIKEIEENINNIEENITKIETNVTNNTKNITELQQDNSTNKTDIKNLKEEVNNITKNITNIENNITKIEEEINNINQHGSEFDLNLEVRLGDLEVQLGDLVAQVNALAVALANLQALVANLQALIANIQTQIDGITGADPACWAWALCNDLGEFSWESN